MGTQHEVTRKQPLLNANGRIGEPGWAKQLVWNYNRDCIAAPWYRRKEWDYYLVGDGQTGVAFTLSDLGYAGMASHCGTAAKRKVRVRLLLGKRELRCYAPQNPVVLHGREE